MKTDMGKLLSYLKMDKRTNIRFSVIFPSEKKAISGIITTVILIALALTVVAIVWMVVNNMVKGQIKSSESCFGIYDKVKINRLYTCWKNSSSELRFSIGIGDIEVNEILVAIASSGETRSFKITSIGTSENYVFTYPDRNENITLPEKNSGLTYVHTGFENKPELIEIAPVISGEQCGISDSLYEIENCY